MNRNTGMFAGQIIGWMGGQQVVGMDIAKSVFQLHTVDMDTGELQDKRLTREKVLAYLSNRQPCVVAMEACGAAHHWGRKLQQMGHHVKLLHAKAVRPFVLGNKTDVTDARAIWLAVQQSGMRFVAVKSVEQQATLVLHRQRQLLVKMRTMELNALRGMRYEFGAVFPKRRDALLGEVQQALDKLQDVLPQAVRDSLSEQVQRIRRLSEDIAGTGGKVRLLGISKRGDSYLRTLLVHGARSLVCCGKAPSAWQSQLLERRHKNVVIVAQAAKTARIIWAVTAKAQAYEGGHQSSRPQRQQIGRDSAMAQS